MYIWNVEIYMNIIYNDNIKQLNVHWSLLCRFISQCGKKFKFQDLYKINNKTLIIWLFVNQGSYGPQLNNIYSWVKT
jgi:hypothetical protein